MRRPLIALVKNDAVPLTLPAKLDAAKTGTEGKDDTRYSVS